ACRRWPCPSSMTSWPADQAGPRAGTSTLVLYLIGEYGRSLGDCEGVLALEPRHFDAFAGIDLIQIQKDKPREALTAFCKALAVNPFLKERLSLVPELECLVGERHR